MKWLRYITYSALLFMMAPAWSLQITHVRHQPDMINIAEGQTLRVLYVLSESADVHLNIYDDRDYLVRRIIKKQVSPGEHDIHWDGHDQAGRPVPSEAYRYTLVATQGENTVEHDLSDVTGNGFLSVRDIRWNVDKQQFEYSLKKTARVLIRVGIDNHGPLMGTIINWLPRPAGQQQEYWNGMDASQAINLAKHPKLETTIQAYSLSDNTVLVGPNTNQAGFINDISWKKEIRRKKRTQRKVIAAAYQQSPDSRGDYEALLTLPETHGKTKSGLPILKGQVPVVLNVPEDKRDIVLTRRAEPVLFIDGQFALENEVGFLPMTWIVDVDKINEGEHYFSVNLRGYEGNFGVATIKFYVKR